MVAVHETDRGGVGGRREGGLLLEGCGSACATDAASTSKNASELVTEEAVHGEVGGAAEQLADLAHFDENKGERVALLLVLVTVEHLHEFRGQVTQNKDQNNDNCNESNVLVAIVLRVSSRFRTSDVTPRRSDVSRRARVEHAQAALAHLFVGEHEVKVEKDENEKRKCETEDVVHHFDVHLRVDGARGKSRPGKKEFKVTVLQNVESVVEKVRDVVEERSEEGEENPAKNSPLLSRPERLVRLTNCEVARERNKYCQPHSPRLCDEEEGVQVDCSPR